MAACHPLGGLDLAFSGGLLVGPRFLVGLGRGRKRRHIRGAYGPDDPEYLDLRLTRDNRHGEQFGNRLRRLRERHPEVKEVILYRDNARYYGKPVAQDWLARHPEFHLGPVPPSSPNRNRIERLGKSLRQKAWCRWHQTLDGMQGAVAAVLGHLDQDSAERATLLVEQLHLSGKQEIPVEYQGMA